MHCVYLWMRICSPECVRVFVRLCVFEREAGRKGGCIDNSPARFEWMRVTIDKSLSRIEWMRVSAWISRRAPIHGRLRVCGNKISVDFQFNSIQFNLLAVGSGSHLHGSAQRILKQTAV
jgi:hypothetical protein